jgi:hypothetical protein
MVFTRDILSATRLERAPQSGSDGSSPAPPPSPSSSPGTEFTDKQNPGSRPWISPRLFTPGRWDLVSFPDPGFLVLNCYSSSSPDTEFTEKQNLCQDPGFSRDFHPGSIELGVSLRYLGFLFCYLSSSPGLEFTHNQTKSWVYTQDYPQIFHPRPTGPWVSSPIQVFCYDAIHYG